MYRRLSLAFTICLILIKFDLLGQTEVLPTDKSDKRLRVGFKIATGASFLDFKDLEFFDIPSDYQITFGAGLSLDWKVTDYNHIRLEPTYNLVSASNVYDQPFAHIDIQFLQHQVGLDFIPVALRLPFKYSPTFSLGGFYRYGVGSTATVAVNDRTIYRDFFEINPQYSGLVLGAGCYVKRTLIEARVYRGAGAFLNESQINHTLNQFSLVLIF